MPRAAGSSTPTCPVAKHSCIPLPAPEPSDTTVTFTPACRARSPSTEQTMSHAHTETPGAIRVLSAVPTFLVADVAATAQWYAEHLGFETAGHVPARPPYVYASVQRAGAEIMLLNLADYKKPDLTSRRPAGLWDAYIRMNGVHALYETVR